MKTKAYCVKCKAPKPMADAVEQTMANGRRALKGKCAKCGTGMFKILGGAKGEANPGKAKPAASSKTAIPAAPASPTASRFRLTFFHD